METVVVTLRHPDFCNETEVFGGPVTVIDIDEGGAFDVTKIGPHSPEYEVYEVEEWALGHTHELLSLGNEDARQHIGKLVGQVLQILRTGSC